jgi:hypothetical protein
MSALKKQQHLRITDDINLVYDFTEKPNLTNLRAHEDRAVVAKFRADLVLPSNKILTVDINFDNKSSYHNNTMMIMDDFGVEMLVAAFTVKYGQEYADKIQQAWNEKQDPSDPRKPTYMLVQKPTSDDLVPKVFVGCGKEEHKNVVDQSVT